jgi:MscS family membrane protein
MDQLTSILSITVFSNSIQNILISILLILGVYSFFHITKKILKNKVAKFIKKTATNIDDIIFDSVMKLVNMSAHFVSIFIVSKYLHLPDFIDLFIKKSLIIIGSLFITWILQSLLIKILDEYFKHISKNVVNSFLPFVKNILKILLWFISIIFILSNLGYSITSLAAGLGIGGLAIALAVKPSLEAFFASIAIFSGKPFKIGDMITFDSYGGTVKHIGLRTTTIQTFSGTEVIVPNVDLTNNKVENITKRKGERIDASIGITYDMSSKKTKKAMSIIRKVIDNKKHTKDDIRVWFDAFGDSALILKFTFFIDASEAFMIRRETISDINFEIKEAFEKEAIDMAFPTQTIYMKK